MSFEEDSLKYYEDYFQTRIIRFAHPSIYGFWTDGTYTDPVTDKVVVEAIEIGNIWDMRYEDVHYFIKRCYPEIDKAYQASGVRAADSIVRHSSIKKHGAVTHSKKTWFLSEQMLQLC